MGTGPPAGGAPLPDALPSIVHALRVRVRQRVEAVHAIPAGAHVLAAVSGGADSTALADTLAALASRWRARLTLVHVDHGLRPDSAAEADHVAGLAGALGVPFHGMRVTVSRRADGGASEAAARAARWAALRTAAAALDASCVATGHTADDQAETLLLRLGRGTGPRGLSAIGFVDELEGGLRVVRPLLRERRADLVACLTARGLTWIEDPSNADPAWLRNRVRAELVPQLAALFGDGVVPRLADLAAAWGAERDAVAGLVAALEGTVWRRTRREGAAAEDVLLDAARLAALPAAAARHVVVHALAAVGVRTGFDRRHLAAILGLADTTDGSASVDLPGGRVAVRRYGALRIGPPATAPPVPTTFTIAAPGRHAAGALTLAVERIDAPPAPLVGGPGVAWFDAGAPLFPLRLRPPHPGERVALPGGGRRKASRVLVDRKVPCDLRPRARLLLDAVDRALALVWPSDPAEDGVTGPGMPGGGIPDAGGAFGGTPAGLVRLAGREVPPGGGAAVRITVLP